MVEGGVGAGAGAAPVLLPGFVAAAVGYVVFVGFGDWGGLDAQASRCPTCRRTTGRTCSTCSSRSPSASRPRCSSPCVRRGGARLVAEGRSGSACPGCCSAAGSRSACWRRSPTWLGADSQDVLFSGQASVPALVGEDSTRIVLVLLVAKALAYAISLGCGFRGGPIFPAIFLGVAIATLPVVWFDVSPTLAVAVGAAAGMAADARGC